LGESLSEFIEAGDLITLDGDLAAGKTTFVKGILLGLNFESEVTSPTFTLINEYEARHRVIHMDCYRENNLQRWINLGIQDYFYSDDVKLIEWPEIISMLIPKDRISIILTSVSEFERKIYIK
jgi:tRNA threonylcarbamoyladenosine biosynthesis protein TsaE